ncbi:nuclear pore glycoprotein p62-like [Homarus americanus]|uniref:nuclear pore glycoprotein p62-like n=1 Tax=Homarus americanus TaxID=6706 RepID=UPI001C47793D|nr:nuclear pore glycoprotein p62-like [Homarus americanus]
MSFNFTGSGVTGGFSFPTTTTAAASSGFNFGSATTSTAAGTTSYSFAPPAASQPTSSTTPFSFGTNTAGFGTSSGGFSFTGPPAISAPSSVLGSVASTAPPTAVGSTFNFTAPPTSSAVTGGFSLTGSTPAPATNLSLGGSTASPFSFQHKPLGTVTTEVAKTSAPTLNTFPTVTPSTGNTILGAATTTIAPVAPTGLSSLFPTQTQTTTLAPTTSVLGQALGAPPIISTSLPVPATGGLFSNISSASTTIVTPAAQTLATTAASLLGPTPAGGTIAPTISLPVAATTALATLTTATSTSSAASATTAVGTAPTLSVAGLEEKVNKWVSELREQEERLMRQAAHVNSWDQLLQQGHDQVQQLRDTLNKVKTDQTKLQAELDFIQGQQQELEQLIEPLETAAATTTPAQHQGDRQRENMHHIAQNLDSQLRQMTDDLCKIIEHLNTNNSGSQASDPVNTVARVLSAHMDTLKWVDQNAALLTQKIDDVSRSAESKSRI